MPSLSDKEKHAEQMKLVRHKDTRIERLVDWALEGEGVGGYERNARIFEDKLVSNKKREVDFYFEEKQLALFVHGCHWHAHQGCKRAYFENSDVNHKKKLLGTRARDKRLMQKLHERHFRTLIVWECALPDVKSKKFRSDEELRKMVGHEKTRLVVKKATSWIEGQKIHCEISGDFYISS